MRNYGQSAKDYGYHVSVIDLRNPTRSSGILCPVFKIIQELLAPSGNRNQFQQLMELPHRVYLSF